MDENATILTDEALSEWPMRQWVLSLPFPASVLLAGRPAITGLGLGIIYRMIATHLIKSPKIAISGFCDERI